MKEITSDKSFNAENPHIAPVGTLRDFTTTWRVLPITGLALVIGVVSAYVTVALLKLISFFTNVFFFHRLSTAPVTPGDSHLGVWVVAVPVVGGLIVGLIARFGSDKIRGHGIPEAIEAILLRGARVEPKLAVLKPVSAAIAIGSGGPFGAEGPIIMTGGAFGSLIAQFFHLTSAERKTFEFGVLLCCSFGPGTATAANPQGPTAKSVIVLSGGRGRASLNQMESELRSRVPWPVNFSIVDLENPRFEDDSYRESLAEALKAAYGEKPDMVVAVGDPSLRFATEYRGKMFPGVPIVFMSVSTLLADQQKWPGVTGVAVAPGIRDTISLALRLQPGTKTIAVITGESETEKDYLAAVQSELLRRQDRVKELDIIGPPSGQMLERVAALPTDTVVLFHLFPHDSEQPAVNAYDILAAAAQRLPTYSVFPSLGLDRGGIGGAYSDATKDAVLAGQIGARILQGEHPDSIPVVRLANFEARVDWRQLQRWHISESALPPGSVVLFRQPSAWQLYKSYFVAGLSLITIEAALILGLIWQRARRRRTERELALMYERFRMAVEAGRSVGWDSDLRSGRNRWFGDLLTMFGIKGDNHNSQLGDFRSHVHPEDLPAFETAVAEARDRRGPYAAEFRVVRKDGNLRWISAKGKFYFTPNGEPERMLGMATDITERKLVEEALNSLSGQLIKAQEEERSRIAREIHDDYQQRLAMLSIDLGNLAQNPRTDSEAGFPTPRTRESGG